MNFKKFTLAVLLLLMVLFTKTTREANSITAALNSSLTCLEEIKGEYTYVRVFKDGIWWTYVYDGNILIDEFPDD